MSYHTNFIHEAVKVRWPTRRDRTPHAVRAYHIGLEQVLTYRGDPRLLWLAMFTFGDSDYQPYALAGMGLLLVAASSVAGGTHDPDGLAAAGRWVNQARRLVEDDPEINFVAALIALYQGDLATAVPLVASLEQTAPDNYYAQLAIFEYACRTGDSGRQRETYEKLLHLARTRQQTMAVHCLQIRSCLAEGAYGPGLALMRQVAEVDPDDPWLWHNMSIAYLKTGRLWRSARCNKKALELLSFDNARTVRQQLKSRLSLIYHLA